MNGVIGKQDYDRLYGILGKKGHTHGDRLTATVLANMCNILQYIRGYSSNNMYCNILQPSNDEKYINILQYIILIIFFNTQYSILECVCVIRRYPSTVSVSTQYCTSCKVQLCKLLIRYYSRLLSVCTRIWSACVLYCSIYTVVTSAVQSFSNLAACWASSSIERLMIV
jgi:hypothetical protein